MNLQSTYIEDADFVNSLAFRVRLRCQVLVDVLEIGDCDVFLELFVEDDVVVNELNLAREVSKGPRALDLRSFLLHLLCLLCCSSSLGHPILFFLLYTTR